MADRADLKENEMNIERVKKEALLTEAREKIIKLLEVNIALYDCQGDCPEEVAIQPELRTGKYCDKCFANQILSINLGNLTLKELIELYLNEKLNG